ncbi:gluconokinase [Allostella vacuolata]|nr:gluconokinase [Stella vacuolata]
MDAPKVIVVMGVCGVGKTTVGRRLAAELGGAFEEGDAFHPPANVAKMAGGQPLDDHDRAPWLAAMAAGIGEWLERERPTVLACSALKAAYRAVLAAGRPGVAFVHLTGDPALIARRMAGRTDHYMPPSLLPSQLAILEAPSDAVTVAIDREPPALVAEIRRRLAL